MVYELKNCLNGEKKEEFKTTVEILVVDEKYLTFKFDCKNSCFYSANDKYNTAIYNGDVCEAFICTGENINEYYEIEVAPNNCQFLMKMTNYGTEFIDGKTKHNLKSEPIPETENFLVSKVEKSGNDYKVEFSVPLDKIGYKKEIGIRLNAYRIETEGGETNKHLLALNPTMVHSFHMPNKFIKIDL
ncbi:MAG: carbohydrate-binding family 9-like protein [Clostridia bacterium]|nr:carbohydrate-binding family 9-like protein [Clostridia bacterium]